MEESLGSMSEARRSRGRLRAPLFEARLPRGSSDSSGSSDPLGPAGANSKRGAPKGAQPEDLFPVTLGQRDQEENEEHQGHSSKYGPTVT